MEALAFLVRAPASLDASEVLMAPDFNVTEEASPPLAHDAEIRVPTAETWLGLGAGIQVVVAGFAWTIL